MKKSTTLVKVWEVKPEHRREYGDWRLKELLKTKGLHREVYHLKKSIIADKNECKGRGAVVLNSLERKEILKGLNMGDIIQIEGKKDTYYVDFIGFKKVEF